MSNSYSTRSIPSKPQKQHCLLSLLCFRCTGVTTKVKYFIILSLFCLLFVSVVTLANGSLWKRLGTVRFVVNKRDNNNTNSSFNSVPVKVIRHFDSYVNSSVYQKPLKIAIWTSPKLKQAKFRERLLDRLIVQKENQDPCFWGKLKCTMIMDKRIVGTADAVIFFMFNNGFAMNELPPGWKLWRKPNQIWILHGDESPSQFPTNKSDLPEVFNWSISYRRDSDIWLPYGRVVPIEQTRSKDNQTKQEIFIGKKSLSKWIAEKTHLVTGVVSNCFTNSKRERFLRQLKKTGKPVHIYGDGNGCTDRKVHCNFYLQNCTAFWHKLSSSYKFYLAFENSLCVDYITEKFWRSLKLGMVPVVYGGANYSQVAPPGSFIDVRDFSSPNEIMNYLEKLDSNDTEYAKYFEWRRKFKLAEGTSFSNGNSWCQLCEKLRKFKHLYNLGKIANNVTDSSRHGFVKRLSLSAQLSKNWWKEVPDKNSTRGKNACQNTTEFRRFL